MYKDQDKYLRQISFNTGNDVLLLDVDRVCLIKDIKFDNVNFNVILCKQFGNIL